MPQSQNERLGALVRVLAVELAREYGEDDEHAGCIVFPFRKGEIQAHAALTVAEVDDCEGPLSSILDEKLRMLRYCLATTEEDAQTHLNQTPENPETYERNPHPMISPTVGRIVWFHEKALAPDDVANQPLAAIVTLVHSDTCVNLCIFQPDGLTWPRTSVPLLQDDEVAGEGNAYCEWMPYQKQKAAAGNPDSESAEPRP